MNKRRIDENFIMYVGRDQNVWMNVEIVLFYRYRLHWLLRWNVFTMTDATKNFIIYDIVWAPHDSHVAVY